MIVDSKLLKALLAAAPKSNARYYPNGIHVASGRLEVTNGHYLIITRDKALYDEECIFTVLGPIPAKAFETLIDFEALTATHTDQHGNKVGIGLVEVIDGTYPDVPKLIEAFSETPTSSVGFNPEYMGIPFKLFKASWVKMILGGDKEMSKLEFKMNSAGCEIEMYVMPMKV